MKKTFIYFVTVLALVILVTPSVTFASWWNPRTWFKKKVVVPVVQKVNNTQNPTGEAGKQSQAVKVPEQVILNNKPANVADKKVVKEVVQEKVADKKDNAEMDEFGNKPGAIETEEERIAQKRMDAKATVAFLEPNNGGTFHVGDKVTVKWKTSSIDSRYKTEIYLGTHSTTDSSPFWSTIHTQVGTDSYTTDTANDGEETITIPNDIPVPSELYLSVWINGIRPPYGGAITAVSKMPITIID